MVERYDLLTNVKYSNAFHCCFKFNLEIVFFFLSWIMGEVIIKWFAGCLTQVQRYISHIKTVHTLTWNAMFIFA